MKQYTSPEFPPIEAGETIVHEGRMGKRIAILLGVIVTFIPPFIWGPALIFFGIYFGKKAKLVLSNRRVIQVLPKFGGTRITEIPLNEIIDVKIGRASNSMPVSDFFMHVIGGTGDLTVTLLEAGKTQRISFVDLKSPKIFRTKLIELTGLNT